MCSIATTGCDTIHNIREGPLMKLMEKVVSIYAPFVCLGCGAEGKPVCNRCWELAFTEPEARCYRCQTYLQQNGTRRDKAGTTGRSGICNDCVAHTPLSYVCIASEYQGVTKELVRGLKYQRRRAYADTIAAYLDETIDLPRGVMVTHLPTTTRRRRQRGFDHARCIASALAGRKGLVYLPLLHRLDQTHQVGLTRQGRLTSDLRFRCTKDVTGMDIVLIDDVVTTGRSIEVAAAELLRAGAVRVGVVGVAAKKR